MGFKAGILAKKAIPIPTSATPFKIFLHIFGFIADIPPSFHWVLLAYLLLHIPRLGMNTCTVLAYPCIHIPLLGMNTCAVPAYLHNHFFLLGMNIGATSTYPHNHIPHPGMKTSNFCIIPPRHQRSAAHTGRRFSFR